MTVAQTKAARRRWRNDGRYKPKKGSGKGSLSKSARQAATRARKRINAGKGGGTVGSR